MKIDFLFSLPRSSNVYKVWNRSQTSALKGQLINSVLYASNKHVGVSPRLRLTPTPMRGWKGDLRTNMRKFDTMPVTQMLIISHQDEERALFLILKGDYTLSQKATSTGGFY